MNDALDLTNAIEAAESAAGLIGLPGRAERAVRAAAPEVLRAAAKSSHWGLAGLCAPDCPGCRLETLADGIGGER